MTDQELELIFNSITNYQEFTSMVKAQNDIQLKNNIKINFCTTQESVTISINERTINLHLDTFNKIIYEFNIEILNHEQQELLIKKNQYWDKIRNEVLKIDDNNFKVYKEYIEQMYSAQDTATSHDLYLKKLKELFRLIKNGRTLNIAGVQIKSNIELIDYLESFGFQYINQDLNKLNI